MNGCFARFKHHNRDEFSFARYSSTRLLSACLHTQSQEISRQPLQRRANFGLNRETSSLEQMANMNAFPPAFGKFGVPDWAYDYPEPGSQRVCVLKEINFKLG